VQSALELLFIGFGVLLGALVHLLGYQPPRPALKRMGRVIMLLSLFLLPATTALHLYYAWQINPSYEIAGAFKGPGSFSYAESPVVFILRAIASLTMSGGIFVLALLWGVATSRTLYLRWAWWVLLAVLALASLYLLLRSAWNPGLGAVLALSLLAPAALQRLLYRDFHAAKQATRQGRHLEAQDHLQRFLRQIHERPWLQPALWLRWSSYTTSIESMASNELGAVCLALGDPVEADRAWRAAIELDRAYPVPYVNLALLAAAKGDPFAADELLSTADHYGYPSKRMDAAKAQARKLLEMKSPQLEAG
jgi:tetratricopeptide (TPR) repeat protein